MNREPCPICDTRPDAQTGCNCGYLGPCPEDEGAFPWFELLAVVGWVFFFLMLGLFITK